MKMPPETDWHAHRPRWAGSSIHKRRFLLWRIAVPFILVFISLGVMISVLAFIALGWIDRSGIHPGLLVFLVCALPMIFMVLSASMGGWAFRRFSTPLAEVMSAADAVAEGDLSVRVRERYPGEIGRLAGSFNRMAAELERAEQQRRSLTADVAHEIRTPLHIIQGNLEGILDGVYEPSVEHLSATLEEAHLLTRLVNDLQALSLAESGQLPLHPRLINVQDLLEDVATSFGGQAAAAQVKLSVQPAVEGELTLQADPDRLDQVLSNLVANALRYTPAGGEIILRAEASADQVRLLVLDNGAGISPEDLPYVFDRFWRADRSRSRVKGAGSGLGLAIARQFVTMHGGDISVDSRPGEGAAFTVALPRMAA